MVTDEAIQLNNTNLFGDSEDEIDVDEEDDDPDSDSAASNFSDGPTTTSTTIATTITPTTTAITPPVAAPFPIPATTTPVTPPPPQQQQPITTLTTPQEKKPLFQRLWTDEDEIGLLRGFLDHTIQQRQCSANTSSSYHIDNALFYDQVKSRLQLDFNKNQLVEKLRRLKRKYRNAINRITSGKDFNFKTPHEQTAFEISHQIWAGTGTGVSIAAAAAPSGGGGIEESKVEEEEHNNHPKMSNNADIKMETNNGYGVSNVEKKIACLGKRPRPGGVEEDNLLRNVSSKQENSVSPSVIEDAIKSCLSPLLKELLSYATNGFGNLGGMGGVVMPLSFGSNPNMNLKNGNVMDEKWRNQRILELEVYSKRVELVQDQVKSALEELKSMGAAA